MCSMQSSHNKKVLIWTMPYSLMLNHVLNLKSVGYTAVPFFAIAAIWFVTFGLCLSLICVCYCCRRREPYAYSSIAYALSLIFLVLLSITAMYRSLTLTLSWYSFIVNVKLICDGCTSIFRVGCVVLYKGQEKFHSSIIDTLQYVVSQADDTSDTLRNVSQHLVAAKQTNVVQVSLPPTVQTDIDQLQTTIDTSATTLTTKTQENSRDIKKRIDSL